MKYTASRLSEGNKMFPDEIIIDDYSVTVKSPKLFGGVSKSFPLGQISITINTPMIGYSDITLISQGTRMNVHGFTSSDAKEIKFAIERGTANQQEETRKQEKNKRKEEDEAWMDELKRKTQHNSGYQEPYDTAYEEDSGRNLNLSGQAIHNDHDLNIQALNNLYDRMLHQARMEGRELTEFEKISLESIKETLALEGNGGKLNEEYFASSNAHNRAFYNGINDHMSAEEHFEVSFELKKAEEYWNLSPRLRAEQDRNEKAAAEDLKNTTEEIPASQILNKTGNQADMKKMSEEILSRLESETGEKFYLLPEFEKFTLKDEPLQTGYLLANENLQSIRLNFTEDEKLYGVTYWKPDEKEKQFTNYLAHLTFDMALRDIVTYYKNPSIKNLIEYAEILYEFGDNPRSIIDNLENLEKKLIAGDINSLIIIGEPDMYKWYLNHSVNSQERLKLFEDYLTISGDLSGFDLYINLYQNNGKIVLIHSSDTSLRDESFLNIFQQVIAAKKNRLLKRPVNYAVSDSDLKVPDEFWFTGKIIFISSIPSKKLVPLLEQQSNIIDVTRNKEDKIFSFWGHIPIFEIPSGRVKERIKRKAMELLAEAAEVTDNVELSLRSLQKAILIVNALGMDNDEICRKLIKQQCSIVSD